MRSKKIISALVLLVGTVIASSIVAFPFWLEAPPSTRPNPWDRQNPNSNWAAMPPLVAPTSTITPTFSVSPTITPTFTQSPNWTATVSPTFSATPTPSATPTNGPAVVLFEDFEASGTLNTPGDYNDTVSIVNNYLVSTAQAFSGTQSWVLDVNTSGGSWGAGVNIQSNYGMIDATAAQTIEFQIWTPTDLHFSVRFREKGLAGDSNENENWLSPNQDVIGTSAWQTISIPISSFVEDGYGNPGCGPNCGTSVGDNTMQLDQIFMFELQFAGATNPATTLYIDDIRFLVPLGPTPTPTNTPVTTALLWEDFDSIGTVLNPVAFGDGAGSIIANYMISTAQATSGTNSWVMDVDTSATSGWGCGLNIESNYGALDATGATIMRFKIYTTNTVTFSTRFRENGIDDGTIATDENENWAAPNKTVTGMASWQTITLPLSSFSENAYGNVRTGGNSGTVGNNTMDLNAIFQFEFQFATGIPAATFYIDDIEYLVPAPTPTPTPCPSCAASLTLGDTSVGTSFNAISGPMQALPVTLATSQTVMSMAIYITTAVGGNIQMSIYDDNGSGTPRNRLGSTAVFATTVDGIWMTQALTAPLCLPAGNYYLAFSRDTTGDRVNFTIDGTTMAPKAAAVVVPGAHPSTYPSLWGTQNESWSIYANYCP